MIKTFLVTSLLFTTLFSGCSSTLAGTTNLSNTEGVIGTPPQRGLRITEIFPNSPAATAGLQVMDLITQYGEFEVIDKAGFFAAKNHYEEASTRTVEIVVWRGRSRMSVSVRPGWLGMFSDEADRVTREFSSLMQRVNALREIPEYLRDREFKEQFVEGPAKIVDKAAELVDRAERENTLTPAQILVDRIYLILDEAPPEDQKRQAALLDQLIATQPVNYIHMLGNDKFFKDKRYRAAVACLRHYVKTSPDDVAMRLNLGVAYNKVAMYEEAQRAADYVLNNKLELSEHGYNVAYSVKAIAALGLKDYDTSIRFATKAFAIDPQSYPISLAQLAAAQTGDVNGVEAAILQFQEALPEKFATVKLQTDAVRAYALAKANQQEAARNLVRKWNDADRAEGRVIAFWRDVPNGLDVARNWATLMRD